MSMAFNVELERDVDLATYSRRFRTSDPAMCGRILLRSESRVLKNGEPYSFGMIDVEFDEPTPQVKSPPR